MKKALEEIAIAVAAAEAGASPMPDAAWLDKLVRARNREMHDGTRRVAKKRLLPEYLRLCREEPETLEAWGIVPGSNVDKAVVKFLRAKPRRTASGVATITVITKPWPCTGDCVYCPNDMAMPKSYIANEPACQRAQRCYFDPFLQVTSRLRVLSDMGHVTDKVELIVLGGTWSDYPADYQVWFMCEMFRALNCFGSGADKAAAIPHEEDERRKFYEACGISNDPDEIAREISGVQVRVNNGEMRYLAAWEEIYGEAGSPWQKVSEMQQATMDSLEYEQRLNERAAHRCVGLVVETRPELITPEHLVFLRKLGCTKVQMGVQALSTETLRVCEREAETPAIERAFGLLRLFGFKSHVHMMANLPGAAPARDAAEYETLMRDARFIPDELKLYPCCLVESSRLKALFNSGRWRPYTEGEMVDLLARDVLATPPYVRISRMIRDISATDIIAGNKKTNLRQMVEEKALELCQNGVECVREMRMREIATEDIDPKILEMQTISYSTTVSEERFIQWVTPEGKLAGFLRLSLPKREAIEALSEELDKSPISPNAAMIREVHVYGKVAALHDTGDSAQHAGLGRRLVEEAKKQASQKGFERLAVISAIGTREYYRMLGFEDETLYLMAPLLCG